jgi:hypothetical protein
MLATVEIAHQPIFDIFVLTPTSTFFASEQSYRYGYINQGSQNLGCPNPNACLTFLARYG